MVDQELLARNEYPAAENRILKAQAKGWVIRPPLARVSCNGTQKVGMLMARSAL
jgi:hypothetical protein